MEAKDDPDSPFHYTYVVNPDPNDKIQINDIYIQGMNEEFQIPTETPPAASSDTQHHTPSSVSESNVSVRFLSWCYLKVKPCHPP